MRIACARVPRAGRGAQGSPRVQCVSEGAHARVMALRGLSAHPHAPEGTLAQAPLLHVQNMEPHPAPLPSWQGAAPADGVQRGARRRDALLPIQQGRFGGGTCRQMRTGAAASAARRRVCTRGACTREGPPPVPWRPEGRSRCPRGRAATRAAPPAAPRLPTRCALRVQVVRDLDQCANIVREAAMAKIVAGSLPEAES